MSGLGDGDLVVCVNDGLLICQHGKHHRANHSLAAGLRKHQVYRFSHFFNEQRCGCPVVMTEEGVAGVADRFRRLDPHPPEYFAGNADVGVKEVV